MYDWAHRFQSFDRSQKDVGSESARNAWCVVLVGCVCALNPCVELKFPKEVQKVTQSQKFLWGGTSPVLSSAGWRRHWQISLEPFREGAFERDQRCGWRKNLADGIRWLDFVPDSPALAFKEIHRLRRETELFKAKWEGIGKGKVNWKGKAANPLPCALLHGVVCDARRKAIVLCG